MLANIGPSNCYDDTDTAEIYTLSLHDALPIFSLVKTFTPASIVAGSGDHTFTLVVKNTGTFSTSEAGEANDQSLSNLAGRPPRATDSGDCTATRGQGVIRPCGPLAGRVSATIP